MEKIIKNKKISSVKIEYILIHNPTEEVLEITSDIRSLVEMVKFNDRKGYWEKYGLTSDISILSKVIYTQYCIIDQTNNILEENKS